MKRRSILAATLELGHVPAILCATAIANGAVLNNPRTLSSEAKAAYERKDFATFVAKMKEALALRPTHQTHLYNLAVGYALTGHDADALELLPEAASIGYTYPGMEKDPDWQNLRGNSEFEAVSQRLAANAAPVARSATALTIHQKGIVSEGLAYDPETGTFFIGSVYARKILAVDKTGVVQDFSVREDGLWSVLGLKADVRRRALWACTSAQPQ
ncbi:MAG TPA: hypothetical protein VGQ82_10960, partial [Chthoniobacterales bacterium]|nr:hypothetical protein [Chthoniobacterales bacterium]